MAGWRRSLTLLGTLAGAVAVTVFLGAAERGAANTVTRCAAKPLCVDITDQGQFDTVEDEEASLSPTDSDGDVTAPHYLSETVTIRNSGATSNMVNITLRVEWVDEGASTTTAYVDGFSDVRCDKGTGNIVTCSTPLSLRPQDDETYLLIFRTATDTEATGVTVTARVSAKEQTKPGKVDPKNTAFANAPNFTSYEPDDDLDVSIAGGGLETSLQTLPVAAVGQQFSILNVPPTSGAINPRGFYTLSEQDYSGPNAATCPTSLIGTCIGQQVTTVAPGLSPVNVQIIYIGPLDGGTKESDIQVLHTPDSGPAVTISATCSGDLFSGVPTPSSQYDPNGCRRVRISNVPGGLKKVEVDVWHTSNGGWRTG
jgi:hypothetical protein